MSSLKDNLKKNLKGNMNVSMDDPDPKFWLHSGNFVINKIISGRYDRGYPQGRIGGLAGPSGSGKSFVLSNAITQAQKEKYFVLVIDAENALDSEYMQKIGVDTESEHYAYVSVKNITAAAKTIHTLTNEFNEARRTGRLAEMPKLLVVIDSLDFLFTDSMMDKFEEDGDMGSDQGLHAKKLKQLLATLVQDIKYIPCVMLCTKQVYVDQTPHAFPPWKFTESIKFAFSQILLITRLMDKDLNTKIYTGIKLKIFGFKTRFTKPYQQCEIIVPYDTGLDEYEGILPVAISLGVVKQNGSWYTFGETKFQKKTGWDGVKHAVFQEVLKIDNHIIDVEIEGVEETGETRAATAKTKKASLKDSVARITAKESEEAGE